MFDFDSIRLDKVPVGEAKMLPDHLRIDPPYPDTDAAGQIIPTPGSVCARRQSLRWP